MTDRRIVKELQSNIEDIKPFIGRLITIRDRQMVKEKMKQIDDLIHSLLTVEQPINRVTDVMDDMGIPNHLKGYDYIREAVILLIEDKTYRKSITYRLYPDIAKKYETTWRGVERAIQTAIESVWQKQDRAEEIKSILGGRISISKKRPTNKKFLLAVADKIRLNSI